MNDRIYKSEVLGESESNIKIMESYKAPEKYPNDNKFTIFLGGTSTIMSSSNSI